jgi:hypothetical protein
VLLVMIHAPKHPVHLTCWYRLMLTTQAWCAQVVVPLMLKHKDPPFQPGFEVRP